MEGTSGANGVFIGDFVTRGTNGKIKEAGVGDVIVGVVEGLEDIKGKPQKYIPPNTDFYALVIDDPDALFICQDSSDTTPLTTAEIGENCDIVATAGDTVTGRSKMEIDGATHQTTSAQLRLIEGYNIVGNEIGKPHAIWVVMINEHEKKLTTGI
jgi:hypothetical protein